MRRRHIYRAERDALGPVCVYCGQSFTERFSAKAVVEHVEPLSRGGVDMPENTVAACWGCNLSKGELFPLEWVWQRAGLLRGGHGHPLCAIDPPRKHNAWWMWSIERLLGEVR